MKPVSGEYVVLEPDEIKAAVPREWDKTLDVKAFVACDDVDELYFDKPYYLAPADRHADEAFALIREGLRSKNGRGHRTNRPVPPCPLRTRCARKVDGLVAMTLNFDYEVRAAGEVFGRYS